MYTKTQQQKNGFSLLELIVAMGVFSVAAVVVVGSFISLLDAQRRAIANQVAMDNIRFALESMTKEIRTGINYRNLCAPLGYIPKNGVRPFPCSSIEFTNAKGQQVIYRWRNVGGESVIDKAIDSTLSFSCRDNLADPLHNACGVLDGFNPITDSRVRIDDLNMYIIGNQTGDNMQPYALINIQATVNPGRPRSETTLALQTAVSQLRIQP